MARGDVRRGSRPIVPGDAGVGALTERHDRRPRAARPNLLFILADDHAAYLLGREGDARVSTPNLDALASRGVRFASNYCNAPVCCPSRQSMLTGQLPHATAVTTNQTPLADDAPTVARQLRAAGYATGVIGKMHWNRWRLRAERQPAPGISGIEHEPGLHGFGLAMADHVAFDRHWRSLGDRAESFGYYCPRMRDLPEGVRARPEWRPFVDPARVWLNADALPSPAHERDLRGVYLASEAARFMRRHAGAPFALWVSFSEPHAPFMFPIEDRRAYDPDDFAAPPCAPSDRPQVPLVFRDLSDRDKRGIIAACYSSVRYLDRNVGRVLSALDALGLRDETLVVYTSDHGYLLGQHGRFEKACMYEEAMRTPLLISLPSRFSAGRTVRALTESVDIAPTVLEALRAEPLALSHGSSLVPLLEGETDRHRDVVFSEYLENEEAAVRTERWKLVQCSGRRHRRDGLETDAPTPGRYLRLYDLADDPAELRDLASRREHASTVTQLQEAMVARFRATHPEADRRPAALTVADEIDWFLRPRDGHMSAQGIRAIKWGAAPDAGTARS